ncbi:predicted protein [Uncinocarpus reesii 1704]|uniref:Uncharacterized protein n=1 Tax=Uncinocarpus reesii (strain UAMH 1704) TaxID=336963 RepID=C4JNX5_UNCRE|nr:uncharacterized protein UREG_04445 [Uncinocarpus reesii 1704]EEP79599.1 predicted protein [Uncinocarpus reesii 1704]
MSPIPSVDTSSQCYESNADDTAWAEALTREDPNLTGAIYVVDDPNAQFTVPRNKGNEAMVYLTYIIDHYDKLPDVSIFMHFHQLTWHNNDFMDSDSAKMVQHLRSERVIREGYMNLRCHWNPGCPEHIHPRVKGEDVLNVPESAVIGEVWEELFPDTPVPAVLSQPCCAQFAASAETIRRLPRDKYIVYRDWLLNTSIKNSVSGRVWEYLWQYVLGGVPVYCPEEHVCYCDGYGVCFDGENEYKSYFKRRDESRELEKQIAALKSENGTRPDELKETIRSMERTVASLKREMEEMRAKAMGS